MALGEYLRRARDPNKTALISSDKLWTYAELDKLTDRLASSLLELGVRAGDRVAFYLSNRTEIVLSYFACFKIAAVAVPVWALLKGVEVEYILNHCRARVLLSETDLFPEVEPVRPRLTQLAHCFLAGNPARFERTRPFADLLKSGGPRKEFHAVPDQAAAVIMYTSGTTARPKGVTHTHSSLEHMSEYHAKQAGFDEADMVGMTTSMSHMAAFGCLLLEALRVGATALILPPFDPSNTEPVLEAMQKHRVTKYFGLPITYRGLTSHPKASAYDLRSLNFCWIAGDTVPVELQRKVKEVFGVEVVEGCGMTEVAPYCLNLPDGTNRLGSMGPPALGMQLRLVDEQGRDVALGDVGEVLVKSAANMVGYWENPEATAATLQDGWLRTGDLARADKDGYYQFVGRKKQIIVRGGEKIAPQEVEEALYQHPAILEAGVIGLPDPAWGEAVRAYVSLRKGSAVSEAELLQFVRERLAAYKVPREIIFLPELPKGVIGKIDRKKLRDWAVNSR